MGSTWKLVYPDGRNTDDGEILEAVRQKRLVFRWRHLDKPEFKAEGDSLCTIDINPCGSAVKLTITHTIEREHSKLIAALSAAWPMVISNLKSLLETGSIVLHAPDVAKSEPVNKLKKPKHQDFGLSLTVKASAKETLERISQVNLWWAKNFKGKANILNDRFSVYFENTFVDFRISKIIPDKKIIWLVTDCNLHWISDKKEWNGTQVIWSLTEQSGKTQIKFVHKGLTQESECYESCKPGWTHHINDSLLRLIETGTGFPE